LTDIIIEQTKDEIPKDLLLLADPSDEMIAEYIHSGADFAAKINSQIIGALVVIRTRPKTMEIVNISVYEEYQNKGIGRQLIYKAI
jgi:ribosomal protein S18 acetylase RimI-like enzyme